MYPKATETEINRAVEVTDADRERLINQTRQDDTLLAALITAEEGPDRIAEQVKESRQAGSRGSTSKDTDLRDPALEE